MSVILNRAYRPPVAPIGAHVRIQIAARFIRDEGNYGDVLDYMGYRITVAHKDVTACLDRADRLMQVTTSGILVGHDGRASYLVDIGGGMVVRVHEQQICPSIAIGQGHPESEQSA